MNDLELTWTVPCVSNLEVAHLLDGGEVRGIEIWNHAHVGEGGRDENNFLGANWGEEEGVRETMGVAVEHERDDRNCRVEEVVSQMEVAFVENESVDPNAGVVLVDVDVTPMMDESWAVEAQIHEVGNWDDVPIDLAVGGLRNDHVVGEADYCNNAH